MADDEIHEWVDAVPESIHLVTEAATGFPFLLAKQTIDQAISEAATENQKKGNTMPSAKKISKLLKTQSVHSVNIAGAGSTSPNLLSDGRASRLLADATGQGQRPNGAANVNAYGTAVIKAMDRRVAKAQKKLEKATGDYERTAAKAEMESAARQRVLAKLIAQANAQQITRRGTRFGPNSTDLFSGSTLQLPDDAQLHGLSTGRPA